MISINNLDFNYQKTKVFKDLNITFEKGKIYGLLGENGVGKTTLLKLICGLQKPTKGSCIVDNFIPFDRNPNFLNNIFFIPDEIVGYNGTSEKYSRNLGLFYPNYDHEYFIKICHDFEIDPTKNYKTMSFGQQKKAIIASALALKTEYLFLDEPTNGLDIPSKASLRKILANYCDEKTTLIISTHQVKDVENLLDNIIILDNEGVILAADTVTIASKLFFSYDQEMRSDALYSEMLPGGYINVIPNDNNEESNINIEALFNTAHKNKESIKNIFNNI
ncbi:MAG TPA: ATP-binding cassette domain-containing protein [Bacteroidetes bacterium]|nr:ATP-binding cassette domain-containing protein [Candidatus Limimorpha avicola]